VGVCGLLLGWVLHAIFLEEGHRAWVKQGGDWAALGRWEQWRAGWSNGPHELWHTLCLIRPGPGLWSLVFMGATIGLGMLRWRMVMRVQGLELALGRATEISLVAHFFNSFLLGSTGGDLIKAYYAARETHHLKTEAVVTVFVDRLIGLLSMLVFAVLMTLPNLALLAAHRRLAALAAVIVAMLAAGGAVAGLTFWGGVSRRWPAARAWLRRLPKGEVIERSIDACRRFGAHPRFLLEAFGLSMILNGFCVAQLWVLSRGLDVTISPVALLLIVPVVICIAALPITPSGLGVRENLYVWMLAVPEIHVGATQALSLSLLAYAGSLLWSLIGGVVYLTFKEKHHLTEFVAPQPSVG
jgi:uncharacterized membrane protein YbhN (UPF0104 family)